MLMRRRKLKVTIKSDGKDEPMKFSADSCSDDRVPEILDLVTKYNIRKLELSNGTITAVGTTLIATFIQKHPNQLIELDLHFNQIPDNAVMFLAQCLMNSAVRKLDLAGNPVADAGAAALALTPLTKLHLQYTHVTSVGLVSLLKSGTLQTLLLHKTKISDADFKTLTFAVTVFGDALASNKALLVLDLSKNKLGKNSAAGFAIGLPANKHLVHIDLSSNSFCAASLNVISNCLKGKSKPHFTIVLRKNTIPLALTTQASLTRGIHSVLFDKTDKLSTLQNSHNREVSQRWCSLFAIHDICNRKGIPTALAPYIASFLTGNCDEKYAGFQESRLVLRDTQKSKADQKSAAQSKDNNANNSAAASTKCTP